MKDLTSNNKIKKILPFPRPLPQALAPKDVICNKFQCNYSVIGPSRQPYREQLGLFGQGAAVMEWCLGLIYKQKEGSFKVIDIQMDGRFALSTLMEGNLVIEESFKKII